MKEENVLLDLEYNNILTNIESLLLIKEVYDQHPVALTEKAFRASLKIFMSAILSKMWSLQEEEGMDISDRGNMADKVGNELRELVRTYTGIDTHKLYE